MKRIICMLVVMAAVATAAQAWTVDGPSVGTGGWNAIWNGPMSWDVADDHTVSGGVNAWWFIPQNPVTEPFTSMLEGGVNSQETMKWYTRPTVAPGGKGGTNRYLYPPDADAAKWGVTFVDESWSGQAAGTAVIASYISTGYLFGQNDWGYQRYQPDVFPNENLPYFKTDARIAAVNADEGTILQIRAYAYDASLGSMGWQTADAMTLISNTDIALGEDYVWQIIHCAVAKPINYGNVTSADKVWFEIEILNGNEDTKVYIDEICFVSDVMADPATYGTPTWLIPEPATMSILALGGLLLRRKK